MNWNSVKMLRDYLSELAGNNTTVAGLLKYLKLSRMRFFAMKGSANCKVEYVLSPLTVGVELLTVMEKYTARGFTWSVLFRNSNTVEVTIDWHRAKKGKAAELKTIAMNAVRSETFVTEDEMIEIALCGVTGIRFQPCVYTSNSLSIDQEERFRIGKLWEEKGLNTWNYSTSLWLSWTRDYE